MRAALALFVLLLASPVFADTATLPCVRDNTLYESATGNVSNGAGPTMFAGRTAQASNFRRRALVRFDVASAVPPGSIITSATLALSMSQAGSPFMATMTLHRVTADWGEGTSNGGAAGGTGAPATAGDATWLHRFFNTTLWATAGGDFTPAASASQTVALEGPYAWSSAGMVADAQAWLDTPASNFGWLVRGDEATSQSVKRFDTREALDPAVRPTLTLEFTPPGTPVLSTSWGRVRADYR